MTKACFIATLESYGYRAVSGMSHTRMVRETDDVIHYADHVVQDGKACISLFGASGPNADHIEYDLGKLRISNAQLRSLLTILTENHP